MTWVIVKGLLLCLALAYGAYADIKTREVPNIVPLVILAAGCIGFSPLLSFTGLLVMAAVFFFAAYLSRGGMGGGDIRLMAASGFALGAWGGILQTIIGLSLAVFYAFIRARAMGKREWRKETIPLVPFLGAGGVLSYLLTVIGGSI